MDVGEGASAQDGGPAIASEARPDGSDGETSTAAWLRRTGAAALGAAMAPAYLWRCDRVGPHARTLGRPRIVNAGRIEIGLGLTLDSRSSRTELVTGRGARIVIGSHVTLGHGTLVIASRLIEVGDRVTVGPYCVLVDGESPGAAAADPRSAAPIWVGDGVTLGARVTLLPGAIVGAGTVVLAGSVVAGILPARVLAAGNPAAVLRRFDAAAIASPSPARRAPLDVPSVAEAP